MRFSVIIATRNRPDLLARALRSVASQSFEDREVVLVDDSDDVAVAATNRAILAEHLPLARYVTVGPAALGRGAGAARNCGLAQAGGDYVLFLDDDDEWVDPAYLCWLDQALQRHGADLHLADQEASGPAGDRLPGPIWIEDLGPLLREAGRGADDGSVPVGVVDLLQVGGFAHLNTVAARRALLWDELGGFDERLRYEEDRDLYYRLIDRARQIVYAPRLVARHYVPAGAARTSASTSLSRSEKLHDQAWSSAKLLDWLRDDGLRARVRREHGWVLRRLSAEEAGRGETVAAFRHATAALRAAFGWKWLAYTAWLGVKRLLR